MHDHRESAVGGIFRVLHSSLTALGITWDEHSTIQYAGYRCSFKMQLADDGHQFMRLADFNATLHKLRVLLRKAIAGQEAARRQYLYSNLSCG